MSKSRSTSGLALTATAALLGLSTLGLSPAAQAAPAPDQVTVSLPTTAGTPGQAQSGSVLVTAAGSAVSGATVVLTLDHGFFTTGTDVGPFVVGAPAGNLEDQGRQVSVITDQHGLATFEIAIARDAGFDDDGAVSAVVSASADTATARGTAAWTSAHPLNGGAVDVAVSATQANPVAPTVSGDRTAYDVVTRDQFGNVVLGAPVSFIPGGTSSFDYSDNSFESNVDSFGDFWVVSDVPGSLGTTVTWEDAPTYRYTSTSGATSGAPASGTADVDASTSVRYYDVSFAGSSYAITPSAPGLVAVGDSTTQTVTVTDQLGRPVRGLEVRFFRFGPDETDGNEKANRATNALGQAAFSYVGAVPGTGKVTATVSDGVSQRTLTALTGFRWQIGATLSSGASKDDTVDVLKVRASRVAEGAKVLVYRVLKHGTKLKRAKADGRKLDERGRTTLTVADTNGRRKSAYVVVVQPTSTTFAVTSSALKVH